MLGTSRYYKLSAIFSDTKEVRNIYYIDDIFFDLDHICVQGGMLNLEEPVVSYGLRLCNASTMQAVRAGDFVPVPLDEGIIYFDAVDKIMLTELDDGKFVLFEKKA